jgi:hypothetical protein
MWIAAANVPADPTTRNWFASISGALALVSSVTFRDGGSLDT